MKKTNIILFAASLLLAVILSSCGGGGGVLTKSPSDIVKAGINAVKDKDYTGAMKYYKKPDGTEFTTEENQKMTMLFTMATSKLDSKKGLKEVVINEEKIAEDGNTATVKYTMVYNDGTDEKSDATLHKINGNWYMIIGK